MTYPLRIYVYDFLFNEGPGIQDTRQMTNTALRFRMVNSQSEEMTVKAKATKRKE